MLHCAGSYLAGAGAGAAGAGNGDPAGAAAAGLGFGFFGRIGLRAALGGGPAGCSSPTTGLGSIDVDAGVEKSPGILITWTGTVSGWNRFSVKVTVKFSAGTETEQGVLQPGPDEVLASAPEGIESIWTETVGGVGLNEKEVKESVENDEQPAKPSPATALTMTRRIIYPSLVAANCHSPSATIRASGQPRNHADRNR